MTSHFKNLSSKYFIVLVLLVSSGVIINIYILFESWNNNVILSDKIFTKDSLSTVQLNVLNGCGKSGVADKVTLYLRNLGFDVVDIGNYQNFNVKETLVIDRVGIKNNVDNAIPFLVATHLGITNSNVVQQINPLFYVNTTIVIGNDFDKLKPWK